MFRNWTQLLPCLLGLLLCLSSYAQDDIEQLLGEFDTLEVPSLPSQELQAQPADVAMPEISGPLDQVATEFIGSADPDQADPTNEPADSNKDAEPMAPVRAPANPETDEVMEREFERVYVIRIEGAIFGQFNAYLRNRLEKAKQIGADLIVIDLTTPGGRADFSIELANDLSDIDWAITAVYIPREAISGGAILSLGADRIYMNEGALIGDAGPIKLGMRGFEHAEEKALSYLTEAIGSIAESKDRPSAIAQAMVDRNLAVYEATETATGKATYITEIQRKGDAGRNRFEVGLRVPETGQNRFLTLEADRAQELGIADQVFASERDFWLAIHSREVIHTEIGWVDRTVFILNQGWVSGLLIIIGVIGIYLELAAPGMSVAGLTASLCFSLFFWSHFLGGTAGWLEVVLFLLGIVCMICELFVLPGFGVFGVAGLGLMGVSLVMASQDFLIPNSPQQWSTFQTNIVIVFGIMMGVFLLLFFQIMVLDSLPGLSRLQLKTPEGLSPASDDSVPTTQPKTTFAVGMVGKADSDLRPSGKVHFGDELTDVISEGDYIDAETPVRIVRVEGNRIIVRKHQG